MEGEVKEGDIGNSLESPEVSLKIRKEDIHPEIPESGGTVFVLQVNARDRRDPKSPEFGALMPKAAEQTVDQGEAFFKDVFERLTSEERAKVAIVVCASDAKLKMPAGTNSDHKRAMETGEKVLEGIRKATTAYEVNPNQLLNDTEEHEGKPVGVDGLRDLLFWSRPEFVEYMKRTYGSGRELWKAYEADEVDVRRKRMEMGVEGPLEIAIRTRKALTGLTVTWAKKYHEEHPGALVFIWVIGHYDNVAPWVNGYVFDRDPRGGEHYIETQKGGGIAVNIDPRGETAKTTIGGKEYQVRSLLSKPY